MFQKYFVAFLLPKLTICFKNHCFGANIEWEMNAWKTQVHGGPVNKPWKEL